MLAGMPYPILLLFKDDLCQSIIFCFYEGASPHTPIMLLFKDDLCYINALSS
jgi:hypothetical protein